MTMIHITCAIVRGQSKSSIFLLRIRAFVDESSFEIVDMEFLRSPTYLTFFDYLDKKGGIFYEVRGVTF